MLVDDDPRPLAGMHTKRGRDVRLERRAIGEANDGRTIHDAGTIAIALKVTASIMPLISATSLLGFFSVNHKNTTTTAAMIA